MENKKPENPSAFPLVDCTDGITLRDYFAAKAMQALFSNKTMVDVMNDFSIDWASKSSYEIADAMLKQREL